MYIKIKNYGEITNNILGDKCTYKVVLFKYLEYMGQPTPLNASKTLYQSYIFIIPFSVIWFWEHF